MDKEREAGAVKTIHFVVSGRVQGVFFRASCKERADDHGIKGWVRNLADGRVEGMATAGAAELEAFKDWLKKGPRMARVSDVRVEEVERRDFARFEVK